MFKKKDKNTDVELEEAVSIDKPEVKKKSDKSIKPKSPKSMAGKKVLRTVIWIAAGLIFLKGTIAWTQGTRVINETNVYGSNESIVSDSVKGFATDFATEYFNWDANFTADRNKRIEKFIKGIESDMGLKSLEVKSSSKVSSAEVYGSNVLDEKHIDITVVVWRTVSQLPNQIEEAKGTAETPKPVLKKAYMVVPITLAKEGPVIESYPRFVSEQEKGITVDQSQLVLIGESSLIEKGTELADSYLRSWYEGNVSQLKYFYADNVKSPTSLRKSEFNYDSMKKVAVFKVPDNGGTNTSEVYQIKADVIVKSDLEEPFSNSWSLSVIEKDGKLFVLSNGMPQYESSSNTNPISTNDQVPASSMPDNDANVPSITDAVNNDPIESEIP
ncbi:conjugal transfer protein [Paenibacillus sp. 2TAB26]|uniref:conjugal transfer protein n=1 Tax=Paenibacillus sp. 2TAB26 TaxID=3233005 RepID=UPI003F9B8687